MAKKKKRKEGKDEKEKREKLKVIPGHTAVTGVSWI